eukprot:gene7264-11582_t
MSFPHDITLDETMDAIKGSSDFRVFSYKEGFTFIKYQTSDNSTFPDISSAQDEEEKRKFQIRRECRGIGFDNFTKKCVCRRFHKFFNINEKEETNLENIDFSKKFYAVEKIDGCLISPILMKNDEIRYTSMSGFTELSYKMEKFIDYSKKKNKTQYNEFSEKCLKNGKTPLFEWTDPEEPIIIKHQKPNLILLNIRDIKTGEYTSYEELLELSKKYTIPVVKRIENLPTNEHLLLKEVYQKKSIEGYVIIFKDEFYKCKTNFYSCAHGISPNAKFINERAILKSIGLDVIDDVVSTLNFSKQKRYVIHKWRDEIYERIETKANKLKELEKLDKKKLSDFDVKLIDFYKNSNQNLTSKQVIKLFIVDVTMNKDFKLEKKNFLKWLGIKEMPATDNLGNKLIFV